MEEEIVSLKTAKLLKEKGFHERCRAYWHTTAELPHCELSPCDYNNGVEFYASSPTQASVQRWLREVHNIIILVGCVCDFIWIDLNCTGESKATVEYWYYDITVAEKWLYNNTIHSANKFDTYEEAMEAAIEVSLTLI